MNGKRTYVTTFVDRLYTSIEKPRVNNALCVPHVAATTEQYRFKDTGGSRDTHETDTRISQTNLKTNPTHRLTRQTTPEPRDARVL